MFSENSNEDSDVDVGKDVALHESFRPRHKYKANGHQTRFHRSEIASNKDQEVKIPHCAVMYKDNEPVGILQVSKILLCDIKIFSFFIMKLHNSFYVKKIYLNIHHIQVKIFIYTLDRISSIKVSIRPKISALKNESFKSSNPI